MSGLRLRILVVEDDPDLVLIMQHELALAGHEVLVAGSGAEALALAHKADLVLLDFHLPGTNGLEVMGQLKELLDPPSVVMITGDDLSGLDEDAMRAGAVDFVPKRPGYLRALPGIVQRAARQHDLARRVQNLEAVSLRLMSAETRDEAVSETLLGACRMLRGRQAALVEVGEDARVVAQVGDAQEMAEHLLTLAPEDFPSPGRADAMETGSVLIRLPPAAGDCILYVSGMASDGPTRGELDLAEAYGRVAASALQSARRNLQQQELLATLRAGATVGATVHGRVLSAIVEQLRMADTELAEVLADSGLATDLVRRLARAEAHLVGARQAAEGLLRPPSEG